MSIPTKIRGELELLARNGIQCYTWHEVKKHLLKCIPSNLRKLFSTRDPKTKKSSTNVFENQLIKYCKTQHGWTLRTEDEN